MAANNFCERNNFIINQPINSLTGLAFFIVAYKILKKKVTFDLDIPKGCNNNVKMVKKGFGNIEEGKEQGNLEIIINYIEHETFNISDNHLVILKKIKYGTSLLGTKFYVKLLDGNEINFLP